jgi:hypothetical protein
VEAMGNGKLMILILTECSQKDDYKVEKILYKELHKLFDENNIEVM